VFGILKSGGKVYTKMIVDTKTQTFFDALKSKLLPDSVAYTDSYRSYDILDVSDFKHYRIKHSKLFADKLKHIKWFRKFLKPS
jgi:transposase